MRFSHYWQKGRIEGIEEKILSDNLAMHLMAAKLGFSLYKTADFVNAELEF